MKIEPNQILALQDCLNALMVVVINEKVDPQSLKQARDAIIKAGWSEKLSNAAEAKYERQESLRYRRYSYRAGDRG